VSHATSAPLWNEAKTPHSTCEIAATRKECAIPSSAKASPEPTSPITTDSRRLIVSATTPVGTSHSRYVPSRIVPNSTSWNGVKPSVSTTKIE
jgi:hypothetical protein